MTLRGLQRRLDDYVARVARAESLVSERVVEYHRAPSPAKHRDVAIAVRLLLVEQGGRE